MNNAPIGPLDRRLLRRVAETLLFGVLGGGALQATGFPAGWLCGSMAGVMAAALMGRLLIVPDGLRGGAFILLGASMGTALTPETVEKMETWHVSIAMLMLSVAATMMVGTQYLIRRHGWDVASARLSSVPGALSAVLAIASDVKGDTARITISQTLRQIVLVCLVPVLLYFGPEAVLVARPPDADLVDLVLMLAAGSTGGLVCARLGVPGGLLVGALLGSGGLHAAGGVAGVVPQPLLVFSYVVVGSAIGSRLRGTRISVIVATLRPALGSIATAIGIAALFAGATSVLTELPFNEVWLAFAPGGVEAMTILAFILNLDPSFVSAHHVIRLIALMLLSPLWTMGLPRIGRPDNG